MSKTASLRDVTDFINHIHKGLKRYGLASRNGKLKPLVADKGGSHVLERLIFTTVADQYRLSVRSIKSSSKRGAVTEARAMAIIFLDKHMKMPQAEIASIFNLSKSLISKRIKAFKSARDGDRSDKLFCQDAFIKNYQSINEKIISFKNSNQWLKR